jgi:hypothetical protein
LDHPISNYTSISLSIQNKRIKYYTFQSCCTLQDLDGQVSSTKETAAVLAKAACTMDKHLKGTGFASPALLFMN